MAKLPVKEEARRKVEKPQEKKQEIKKPRKISDYGVIVNLVEDLFIGGRHIYVYY